MTDKWIYLKDLKNHLSEEVLIKGWVYNFRSSGKIAFLQVRDGSDFAQCVVAEEKVSPEAWKVASEMTLESSVELTGTVAKHPKLDVYEIQVTDLKFVQVSDRQERARR
jgi:asparaginyl-tRNA synthetase